MTIEDVVAFADGAVNVDEIAKTVIIKERKSDKMYAVLLRGKDKIDLAKIKKLIGGQDVTLANSEEVKKASGVEPGAVCPFLVSVPLFVDKKVAEMKKINTGSGDHLYGLEFQTEDLNKVIQYQVVDIVR
ncbi:MAG: YbaK/EbsC family protein [Candidatus Pacebacteria bacterium]|nr:YbaK/EbsC family protein [Candidatus Paceibacterota bacterium]